MQPSRPASTSTRPAVSPMPRPPVQQVNTQTKVLDTVHGRILCIADIRGRLSHLNDLARDANAKAVIHTGDFGFFEAPSLERINDRTLRHLTMYSPLIPGAQRTHLLSAENGPADIRSTVNISLLSEFPLLLSGQIKLNVPVYTVWGACEDVVVIEKFRTGTYSIDNLHLLDEATTRCIDVGGVKLRLLGLGGALVPHKIFDNGDGNATIAGGQGTMWTTALQIGELVDTAQRVFDISETRLLITHSSPGREGIMAQLALVLKADLTISAGLHFRYATSYNEFSVQPDFEGFRHKLALGKEGFDKVWETVKGQVDALIDDNQRILLDKALSVIERVPPPQSGPNPTGAYVGEEPAWKNCWNWNLCDAAYGSLVLDVKEGRVSAELKSQGFNYAYRRSSTPSAVAPTPTTNTAALPAHSSSPPTKGSTPAPFESVPSNVSADGRPATSSPTLAGKGTPHDKDLVRPNGMSTSQTSDKAEKDKAKKKDKKEKERKDKERAERDSKDKEGNAEEGDNSESPTGQQQLTVPSGKSTPIPDAANPEVSKQPENELKSPVSESTGVRTPTGRRPARNPWTLFMRMNVTSVNEAEVKEFFGEAQSGITRVTCPAAIPGRNFRIAYVEFGDEDAMKAGLEKHAETFKDITPEVKIAADRERDGPYRGAPRGRGRGGGFAARGFAAAGLTRQPPQGRKSNGDNSGGQEGGSSGT